MKKIDFPQLYPEEWGNDESWKWVFFFHPSMRNVQSKICNSLFIGDLLEEILSLASSRGSVSNNEVVDHLIKLGGDDLGRFGLSMGGYRSCIETIRPTLDFISLIMGFLVRSEKNKRNVLYTYNKICQDKAIKFLKNTDSEKIKNLREGLINFRVGNSQMPRFDVNPPTFKPWYRGSDSRVTSTVTKHLAELFRKHYGAGIISVYNDIFNVRFFSLIFKVVNQVSSEWKEINNSSFPGIPQTELYPWILSATDESEKTVLRISNEVLEFMANKGSTVQMKMNNWLTTFGKGKNEVDFMLETHSGNRFGPDVNWFNFWADKAGLIRYKNARVFPSNPDILDDEDLQLIYQKKLEGDFYDDTKPIQDLDYYADFIVENIDTYVSNFLIPLSRQENVPDLESDRRPEHLFEDAVAAFLYTTECFDVTYQLGYKLSGKKRPDGLGTIDQGWSWSGVAFDAKSVARGSYHFTKDQMLRLLDEINILRDSTEIDYLMIVAPEFTLDNVEMAHSFFEKEDVSLLCYTAKHLFTQGDKETIRKDLLECTKGPRINNGH